MNPGNAAKYCSSGSPSVAWPKVPDSTAITVTPICTVASNRDGSALSSTAALAPALPASASGCSRAGRAETSAISAIAKNPFNRIRRTTIERCSHSIATPWGSCEQLSALSGGKRDTPDG